ncbi:MAG: hypothetical protein JO023_15930 [Chloroflexi bacterium]|nr:hypothetical protein [Chloroflexota bacterium]
MADDWSFALNVATAVPGVFNFVKLFGVVGAGIVVALDSFVGFVIGFLQFIQYFRGKAPGYV